MGVCDRCQTGVIERGERQVRHRQRERGEEGSLFVGCLLA